MEWTVYLPKSKKHTEEQITITANRSFILNRPATDRIKDFKYVRLLHRSDGAIAIKPLREKELNTLKLHFAPKGNVATISATGLLQEMRYNKGQDKRKINLYWKDKQERFEFNLPKDKLRGRKRKRRRKSKK